MINHKISKLKDIWTYVFLVVVSLISILPLAWMLIAATNKSADAITGRLLPGTYLIENFKNLCEAYDIWNVMGNSVVYSVAQTVFCLIICSIAGYSFEVFHDKGKDILFTIILTSTMVPFIAIMVPLFQMFAGMKALDTTSAFLLPSISAPVIIMLFRQSSRSFPTEILEAARIDGLTELQIFIRVYAPAMKATYAAAATVTFMNAWNAYLWPKVIFQSDASMNMPMLVSSMVGEYTVDYGMLMLGVAICTLPTIVVFFVLQKYFTEGIAGAVK